MVEEIQDQAGPQRRFADKRPTISGRIHPRNHNQHEERRD